MRHFVQTCLRRAASFPILLKPSATVAHLRDAPKGGLEVLLLQKSNATAFGGLWVFPGGKIEAADRVDDESGDEDILATAARAAVREAAEETAVALDPASLQLFAHWLPPMAEVKKRGKGFSTFFFAAGAASSAGDDAVEVDGGEISTHLWLRPDVALQRNQRGELQLLPPTWMTLEGLSSYATVGDALAGLAGTEPLGYMTRAAALPGERLCFMWEGDAGWATGDHNVPGPRFRLVGSLKDGLHLERSP